MTQGKKVFIRTFGCQMNEYDSDKMADVLHAAEGFEKTSTPEDADLILFNTCSVREKAQEKVFADLGRVRAVKLARPSFSRSAAPPAVPRWTSLSRRSRSSTTCLRREWRAPLPSCRSWKAAASTAPSASFPTRAARRFPGR